MGALVAGAVIALVLLFVPGKPTDEVVVLPSADGHVGMVVVQRGSERYVLNQPYAVSKTGQNTVTQSSADEVKQAFGNTLQSLPARPGRRRAKGSLPEHVIAGYRKIAALVANAQIACRKPASRSTPPTQAI